MVQQPLRPVGASEIAARRSALPAELQAALDTAPIVLPAWDPMGALAR